MTESNDVGKQIEPRLVEDLLLDPENPRLAEDGKSLTDSELLKKLYETGALDELAMSFSRSGYFWEEPLVVVPHLKLPGKFVVVEGNRRLATLKLLLSPEKRQELDVRDFPELSGEREEELRRVPTVLYLKREDVVPYLGFRHITGTKKWEPHAKARYITQLVRSGRPLGEIEYAIGDGSKAVRKLYQAFVVFEQIRDELSEDVQEIRESFSLLEVMLGQQPIKAHLGIARRLPDSPIEHVVPAEKLDHLREVTHWVFGSKKASRKPVIADSREISQWLAPVIGNKESLEFLRDEGDLEGAFERSGGEREFVLRQLAKSRKAASRALSACAPFKGDTGVQSEIARLADVVDAIRKVVCP